MVTSPPVCLWIGDLLPAIRSMYMYVHVMNILHVLYYLCLCILSSPSSSPSILLLPPLPPPLPNTAASCAAISEFASIFGKLSAGFLSDYLIRNRKVILRKIPLPSQLNDLTTVCPAGCATRSGTQGSPPAGASYPHSSHDSPVCHFYYSRHLGSTYVYVYMYLCVYDVHNTCQDL